MNSEPELSIITPEALEWVGRVYEPAWYDVSATDIAKYCYAIRQHDRRYFDSEVAKQHGLRAIAAPLSFHSVVRIGAYMVRERSTLLEDGAPNDDFPPVRATQAMAGETRIKSFGMIYAGDHLRIDKTLTKMVEKKGSAGPMAIVSFDYKITNQLDELVSTEDYSRILR